MMSASPGASPVARPLASTPATSGSALDQANVAPETCAPSASNAAALNCCVPSSTMEAVLGVTVTLAIGATGGGSSSSLHVPNVFGPAAFQTPEPFRCSEWPAGVVEISVTPMSVETEALAGPPTAVKVPP